ncbi:MAG: lysophospholipid acyltransferase family protein [Candidatus Dependentiae bacterium]|nr:lysophospholipid acyltransferase family protein [Candidatus Dependentiae bacterium]
MLIVLRTLLSYFLLAALVIVFMPFFFIITFIPVGSLFKSRLFFCIWYVFYRLMLYCYFLSVTIKGRENIPNEAAIFAVNHQSMMDIPLVDVILAGRPHVYLANLTYRKSLLLTWLTRISWPIDDSTPLKAMKSLLRAIKEINNNPSIHAIIFPEAGRYVDGKVHDFFSGFVLLAKKTGRPVVPLCIFGINKAYPPYSFLIHRVPITIVIGKPFIYQEHDTDQVFKDRVYTWFLEQQKGA